MHSAPCKVGFLRAVSDEVIYFAVFQTNGIITDAKRGPVENSSNSAQRWFRPNVAKQNILHEDVSPLYKGLGANLSGKRSTKHNGYYGFVQLCSPRAVEPDKSQKKNRGVYVNGFLRHISRHVTFLY